ncbi:MAG: DivIVA domain-containing protein [Bacillota bacterium]
MDDLLTPLDIYNKELSKTFSVWAYSSQEVDEFLDQVAECYEELYTDNQELQERVARLEERLEEYKSREETISKTIDTVKQTTNQQQQTAKEKAANLKQQAKAEAELIIERAEMKAEKIIQEAEENLADKRRKYKNLLETKRLFEAKFKTLLRTHLAMLDESTELEELTTGDIEELDTQELEDLKSTLDEEWTTMDFDQQEVAVASEEDELESEN